MSDDPETFNRNQRDIQTCSNIMRKHTNLTDRHVVDFRSPTEQTRFEEKMRRVSIEMIEYYYRRMSRDTKERARKTLKAIEQPIT